MCLTSQKNGVHTEKMIIFMACPLCLTYDCRQNDKVMFPILCNSDVDVTICDFHVP